jgi:hypothetical protein
MGQRPLTARRRWAIVRYLLCMAQMFGAVVSLVLLITTGVNQISLSTAVLTCLLTTVSVLRFGQRTPNQK